MPPRVRTNTARLSRNSPIGPSACSEMCVRHAPHDRKDHGQEQVSRRQGQKRRRRAASVVASAIESAMSELQRDRTLLESRGRRRTRTAVLSSPGRGCRIISDQASFPQHGDGGSGSPAERFSPAIRLAGAVGVAPAILRWKARNANVLAGFFHAPIPIWSQATRNSRSFHVGACRAQRRCRH